TALNLNDPGHAWHTDRTLISEFGHLIVRTSVATGKIGDDIALMAALGSDQITLAGGTSSAMPHKCNPVKAEALVTLSDHVASLQSNLSRSARHEGFRSGRAWMLEWVTLPQMCMACAAGLRVTADLLADIQSIGTDQS
ncbi:MAG: lyase family protein, partial [Pseudomonadota bacterium]